MLESLYLPIFPTTSLANSVITTVWVGMFVVVFLNLRFGWVLSGLVVPGYLVPLLISKPLSCAVIIFEAGVTYLIVYAFSEQGSRLGKWSSLFGRDRFFALVLISAVVRVVFDGFVFPIVAAVLEQRGLATIELSNELRSFGLIIVALIANQIWKPGLIRGMGTLAFQLGVTWLLVRGVLMEFTNFSMSNVSYMYEDLAQSILASPKAYIVLLTAGFLASRFNLLYGWDFNGILLPSLLALQWYQPSKILFTFFEAYLILLVARWLLERPLFANANIEGARKLLFFFNISFAYRFVLGHFLGWAAPDFKVSDAYGFGYLLSTLLALKMHDKGMAIHMSRATIQASGSAVLVASAIGFALQLLPGQLPQGAVQAEPPDVPDGDHFAGDDDMVAILRGDRKLPYQVQTDAEIPHPVGHDDLQAWYAALAPLALAEPSDHELFQVSEEALGKLGFEQHLIGRRYLLIRESRPVSGRGEYIIDLASPGKLVVEWPLAGGGQAPVEHAWGLLGATGARAMALGTLGTQPFFPMQDEEVTRQLAPRFQSFREALSLTESLRLVLRAERDAPPQLLGRGVWPDSLSLAGFGLSRSFDLAWRTQPPELAKSGTQAAVLSITAADLRHIFAQFAQNERQIAHVNVAHRIDRFLAEHILLERPERFVGPGTDQYRALSETDLLFADRELIVPLLKWAEQADPQAALEPDRLLELHSRADAIGLHLNILEVPHDQGRFILLEEDPQASPVYSGVWVVRLGTARNLLLQAPYPQSEPGSGEYALALFEILNARSVFISTAHRATNRDGSSDPLLVGNRLSLFNGVQQGFLRAAQGRPVASLQIRGLSESAAAQQAGADMLMVSPILPPRAQIGTLADAISQAGFSVLWAHLDPVPVPGVSGNLQARFSEAFDNADFATLRLSRPLRRAYRQYPLKLLEQAQFQAVGIPDRDQDLISLLQHFEARRSGARLPEALQRELGLYQSQPEIVILYRLKNGWPDYRFERVLDPGSALSFLAVFVKDGDLHSLWNLRPLRRGQAIQVAPKETAPDAVRRFVQGGAASLVFAPES